MRLLVADDHYIVRQGLEAMIRAEGDMEFAGSASTGAEAIAEFRRLRPDILVLDLQLPDLSGHEVLRQIMLEDKNARVVVLSSHDGDEHILRSLQAGARAYIYKDLLRAELLLAIRAAGSGNRHIPAPIASRLPEMWGRVELSSREVEVLRLASSGLSNKEIAATIRISDLTVKTYLQSAFVKLGARDRTHAVTIALRRGILDLR